MIEASNEMSNEHQDMMAPHENDHGPERPAVSVSPPMMDRAFILLRFTLIIATSSMLLVVVGPSSIPVYLMMLMGGALLSNIALLAMPVKRLRSPLVVGAAILGDTVWITAALIATGRFTAEFFYLYFFVLFLAGIGENIRLIALSVIVVCLAYVVLIMRTGGPDQIMTTQVLIRVPFLFSVAIFYGYLVDRVRKERHRVVEDRVVIERLQRNRKVLAEANEALELEVQERKKAEQELRKYSRATEQSPNLVIIIDAHGRIEYVNPLFEPITGSSPDSVLGRGLEVFTEMGAPVEAVDPLVSAIRRFGEWRGEVRLEQEDGAGLWLSVYTAPVRNADGEIVNTLVIASDISQRVKVERQLAEAIVELRRLSQVKSNFVSTVSHELKSPLTAIKNAVTLIDPSADEESNEKFLKMIGRNADRLNYIISDLLDMSKVESGRLTITAEPVDLQSFLAEVVEPFELQAAAASVQIDLEVPDSLPKVVADAKRIEQVVANLLRNALKATPMAGKIVVSAALAGDSATVSVNDTGIGLSSDDQEKVFDAFFQAGNVLEGRQGGTGLGLTICRDLVRGHGSDLHLESELGVGSRFSFSLPIRSQRAEEIIAFENEVRTSFREYPYFTILVIDFGDGKPDTGGILTSQEVETLHEVLHHLVPRALDLFWDQPSHRRVIVVLLSTPVEGGWVVKRRLVSTLATNLFEIGGKGIGSLKVLGPAAYPEDGEYGSGLIECAILVGEKTEEEA